MTFDEIVRRREIATKVKGLGEESSRLFDHSLRHTTSLFRLREALQESEIPKPRPLIRDRQETKDEYSRLALELRRILSPEQMTSLFEILNMTKEVTYFLDTSWQFA